MGITYETLQWIDDSFYFRVYYAAQPFVRVRDTGYLGILAKMLVCQSRLMNV